MLTEIVQWIFLYRFVIPSYISQAIFTIVLIIILKNACEGWVVLCVCECLINKKLKENGNFSMSGRNLEPLILTELLELVPFQHSRNKDKYYNVPVIKYIRCL